MAQTKPKKNVLQDVYIYIRISPNLTQAPIAPALSHTCNGQGIQPPPSFEPAGKQAYITGSGWTVKVMEP